MGGIIGGGGGILKNFIDPLRLFLKDDKPAAAAPTPQPAPATPSDASNAAAQAERDAAAMEERRRRGNSGRASTILTGPLGDTGDSGSASKVLLGG